MSVAGELSHGMVAADSLNRAMAPVRRAWRRRVLLEALVRLVALGLVLLVVLSCAIVWWRPSTTVMTGMRLTAWLLWLLVAAWYVTRALFRPIAPIQLGRYLEEAQPQFGALVITALQATDAEPASPLLTRRVVDRAVALLQQSEGDLTHERVRERRAMAQGLVLLVVIAAGLLLSPPTWRQAGRAMASPWLPVASIIPPHQLQLAPGNLTLPRGAALDIAVQAQGFVPVQAELLRREVGEEQWQREPMIADSAGAFSLRLFDLDKSFEYRVEAGDVGSPLYRIQVTDLPAVESLRVVLDYPSYTGLAAEEFTDRGDVAAVRGTRVTVHTTLTRPIQAGTLRFDNGDSVALTPLAEREAVARFVLDSSGLYAIDLVAPDGTVVPGQVRWSVTVLDDRAPVVRITEPGRDTKATAVEEVPLALAIDDDYGVRSAELRYSVNGGAEQVVSVARWTAAATLTPRVVYTLLLEELALKPGDLIAYHARATDGAGNHADSDIYFVEIRPFGMTYRQADEGGGGLPGGGAGGAGGEQDLSRAQRQLVVAAYNLVRDSATTPAAQFKEDLATLAGQQEEQRQNVTDLVNQMRQRDAAAVDSTFVAIGIALDSAVAEQTVSGEQFRAERPGDAVTSGQRALRHLQQAEAAYREIELQLGESGGGGGGGGAGQLPDDLSDLFELDADRMRNQYEAVQRQAAPTDPADQAVDSAAERLRELARRVERENERLARARQQFEQRLASGNAAGGGARSGQSGAAQRQMAAAADSAARRLERLAREQRNSQLQAAANQARQAADALNRAASGREAEATTALEALRQAGRELRAGQDASARDRAAELAEEARRLAAEQQRLAAEAARVSGVRGEQRLRQAAELDPQATRLADQVRDLIAATQAAAAATRATDPAAARQLADAANELGEFQAPERVEYVPRLAADARIDSASAARFNQDIAAALGNTAERLAGAARAVGSSAERQQERALQQARELVRDLESLDQRGRQDSIAASQGAQAGDADGTSDSPPGEATGAASPRRAGDADARQLRGEVQLRLGAAQRLREQLRAQGVGIPQLDDAIAALERLGRSGELGDPIGRRDLQAEALELMQQAEFSLWQRFGNRPDLTAGAGDLGRVPPAYRDLVAEYYRAIGSPQP